MSRECVGISACAQGVCLENLDAALPLLMLQSLWTSYYLKPSPALSQPTVFCSFILYVFFYVYIYFIIFWFKKSNISGIVTGHQFTGTAPRRRKPDGECDEKSLPRRRAVPRKKRHSSALEKASPGKHSAMAGPRGRGVHKQCPFSLGKSQHTPGAWYSVRSRRLALWGDLGFSHHCTEFWLSVTKALRGNTYNCEGISSSGMSTCHTPVLPLAGIGSRSHLGFETTVKYFCSRLLRTALFSSSRISSGGRFSGYSDVSPTSINPVFYN